RESGERESMAPEIGIVPVDTLVAPGQVVELAVRATPDVERVSLKDDGGGTLALVKDADGATWRVSYRVPMRPAHERWGVSLTARTAEHRWRRVWVFLHVKGDDASTKLPGGADTSHAAGETGNGVTPVTPPEVPGSAAGR